MSALRSAAGWGDAADAGARRAGSAEAGAALIDETASPKSAAITNGGNASTHDYKRKFLADSWR